MTLIVSHKNMFYFKILRKEPRNSGQQIKILIKNFSLLNSSWRYKSLEKNFSKNIVIYIVKKWYYLN